MSVPPRCPYGNISNSVVIRANKVTCPSQLENDDQALYPGWRGCTSLASGAGHSKFTNH